MAECLRDLCEQTLFRMGQLEVIVIDSCSEQDERSIVRGFQEIHGQAMVRYIRTDQREGVYRAWNRGVMASNGVFITNANTDDRHRMNALEILARHLEADPDVNLTYAYQWVTTKENDTFEKCDKCALVLWPTFSKLSLLIRPHIGPQPMWRRSLHDKLGFFDERMVVAGDYEFWLRVARLGGLKLVPEILGLYLKSPESVEHRNVRECAGETAAARRRHARKLVDGKLLEFVELWASMELAVSNPVSDKKEFYLAAVNQFLRANPAVMREVQPLLELGLVRMIEKNQVV